MTGLPAEPGPGSESPGSPARGDRRLPGADLLRAVAVVAVVVIHAAHWPATDSWVDWRVWQGVSSVARFCVPAFLLLGGLLLGFRYAAAPPGAGFMVRRARRTLLPWFLWAPLYFVTGLLITNDVAHSPGGILDWWSGGGGHLYFLILVPQLYLLFMLWPRSRRGAIVLAVVLLAAQIALDTWRLFGAVDGRVAQELVLWHAFEEFPFWIGYFAVGVAAGRLLERFGSPPAWTALLALVPVPLLVAALVTPDPLRLAPNGDFAQGTGAFLQPLLVPLVLALCYAGVVGGQWLMSRFRRLAWGARLLSRHSLGIYIVQALLVYVPGRALFGLLQLSLPWSAVGFVLLVVLTLVLSTAATMLIGRTRLAPIIGEERHRGTGTKTAPAPVGSRVAAA